MGRPSQLEHVTITTGSARLSPRAEVADEVVAQIRTSLGPAGGRLWDGWSVERIPSPAGVAVYDLLHDGQRISACWLCLDRANSERLWDLASRAGTLPGTRLHRPVHVPWLAAALAMDATILGNVMAFADVIQDAGNVGRCVAWALIEAAQDAK